MDDPNKLGHRIVSVLTIVVHDDCSQQLIHSLVNNYVSELQ